MLAGVVEKFHYLKVGLGIVLSFIGLKMLLPVLAETLSAAFHGLGYEALSKSLHDFDDIPIGVALGVVAVVLLASVGASLIWPKKRVARSSK